MTRFCDGCANHICTILGRCEKEAERKLRSGRIDLRAASAGYEYAILRVREKVAK